MLFRSVNSPTSIIADFCNLRLLDCHEYPLWSCVWSRVHLPPARASIWCSLVRKIACHCNEIPTLTIHPHKGSHIRIRNVSLVGSYSIKVAAFMEFNVGEIGFRKFFRGRLENANESKSVSIKLLRCANQSKVGVCTHDSIGSKPG